MIDIVKIKPENFPKRLLEIPDQPKELFIRGTLPSEDSKWLTVVGARKYTEYGKAVTESLISGLRGHNIVIISGLALGIDSIAHKTALATNLKTVAVPGSGLGDSVLYPASNRNLALEIIKNGGALISEYTPDFKATVWSFPRRNRIMAGLSHAILVIEAEQKSGTLITSRLATEYNRDVFTVPGSMFSPNSEGPHLLLKLGATPIRSSEEIIEALGLKPKEKKINLDDLSPEEVRVLSVLKEPMSRDDLIVALEMSTSDTNALLSIMEIKGLITEALGEFRKS